MRIQLMVACMFGLGAMAGCSGPDAPSAGGSESAMEERKVTAADWTGDYDHGFLVHVDGAGFLTATNRDFTAKPCEYTVGGQTDGSGRVDVTAYRFGEEIKGTLERTATGIHLKLDSILHCGPGQVQDVTFERTSDAGEPGILAYWGAKSTSVAIFKGDTRPASGFQTRIDACRRSPLECTAPFLLQDQAFSVLELGDVPWMKVAFRNGAGTTTTGWISAKDLYAHPDGTLGGRCGGDEHEDSSGDCREGLACDEPEADFTVGVCKPTSG